jgi:hypothetical protein
MAPPKSFFCQSGDDRNHKTKYFHDAEDALTWLRERGVSGILKKRDYNAAIDDTTWMEAARVSEDGEVEKCSKFRFMDSVTGHVYAVKCAPTRDEAVRLFHLGGDHHLAGDWTVEKRGQVL